MKKPNRILNKLLFPGSAVILLSVPTSAVLLFYTFVYANDEGPISYISYIISAYATIIVCARISGLVKSLSARVHRNRFLHCYLTDIHFRTHISLYLSFIFNLLYAVMKLFLGAYYRSGWFGTLGVYYTLLSILWFMLLLHVNRNFFGKEPLSELKQYRLCGALLIPMTVILSGVVLLVIDKNEGFQYPGYLIYIVAMYAFYAIIAAAIHMFKYRKYQSPVLSVATVVRLTSALVSILSLEIAMLSQFGDQNDLIFRKIMIGATGAGVSAIILVMAVFMIFYGTKRLKKTQPLKH